MGSPLYLSYLISHVPVGSRKSTDHCRPQPKKAAWKVPHSETMSELLERAMQYPWGDKEEKTQVILRDAGWVVLCREGKDSKSRKRKSVPPAIQSDSIMAVCGAGEDGMMGLFPRW